MNKYHTPKQEKEAYFIYIKVLGIQEYILKKLIQWNLVTWLTNRVSVNWGR